MKPTKQGKPHFHNISFKNRKDEEGVIPEPDFSHPYIVNPPMTEQFVVPPSRVWEKIEKILDEQDKRRFDNDLCINNSSKNFSKTKKSLNIYFAALGATVVGSLVWVLK